MVISAFPFLASLKNYSLASFRRDLWAAVSVTPMAVPQAMAYAIIAGLHPQYGIYACILPVVVAALFGSSRYLAAGPTNSVSMLLFSTLATVSIGGIAIADMPMDTRMGYVFLLTIYCGVIQLGFGLARLGELANFISHSVMVAFGTGAALLIVAGQLHTILGLEGPAPRGFFVQVFDAVRNCLSANPWHVGLAVGTIVLVVCFQRIHRRFPAALASLLCVTIISILLDAKSHGVPLVGSIDTIIPPLAHLPSLDFGLLRDLCMPAMALAVLASVESLAIGKQLAPIKGDTFHGSQELIGQGLGNIVAGISSGIPGAGSMTRSSLIVSAGGQTRFGTVFSGLLVIPLLAVCAQAVGQIPLPALSGILVCIARSMINIDNIRLVYTATTTDRIVLCITILATLIFDLEIAVFIGVVLSLLLFIRKTAHPRVRHLTADDPLLAKHPESWHKDNAIYFLEGTLFFGAITAMEEHLRKEEQTQARLVTIHLNRVFWIDATGAHGLAQFIERCISKGKPVILVADTPSVRGVLQRTGILDFLGRDFVVYELEEALAFGKALLDAMDRKRAKQLPAD